MCFGLVIVYNRCSTPPDIEKVDTVTVIDTLYKDTTIFKDKLVPQYIKIVKRDTVYTSTGDTIQLITEHKAYQDTLTCEDDSIVLKSYITGINSKLDSITASWKKRDKIITNTVTITKYIEKPRKLFTIQPQVGVGYGFFNKKPDVYAGIGVGINF